VDNSFDEFRLLDVRPRVVSSLAGWAAAQPAWKEKRES
jgi:hypothetical protein